MVRTDIIYLGLYMCFFIGGLLWKDSLLYIITRQTNNLLHHSGNAMNTIEVLLEHPSASYIIWEIKPIQIML